MISKLFFNHALNQNDFMKLYRKFTCSVDKGGMDGINNFKTDLLIKYSTQDQKDNILTILQLESKLENEYKMFADKLLWSCVIAIGISVISLAIGRLINSVTSLLEVGVITFIIVALLGFIYLKWLRRYANHKTTKMIFLELCIDTLKRKTKPWSQLTEPRKREYLTVLHRRAVLLCAKD